MHETGPQRNAQRYETAYSQGQFLEHPPEWLVRWFAYRGRALMSGTFLDFGFGSGNAARFLIMRGWRGMGLEVSKAAVRHSEKELPADRWSARVIDPDTTVYPVKDGTCNLILANQVLYYLADEAAIAAALSEFRRILKPGGLLLASFMSRDNEYIARRGQPWHQANVFEVTLPERLGRLAEVVWAPESQDALERLFAGWDALEVGYYDSAYFGKGRNFHWLVSARAPMKAVVA